MSISRTTLRDIREALGRLDKERESLTARIGEIDRQAEALRISHDLLTRLHEEAQADTTTAAPVKNLRNEMVLILREAVKPLHYTDLRDRLESRGITINGVDKGKTVGAHLSNDPRFKKLGKGMWALTSWPASLSQVDDTDDTDSGTESDEVVDEETEPGLADEENWTSLLAMEYDEKSETAIEDRSLPDEPFYGQDAENG